MSDIIFSHPEPASTRRHIRPVFIPYAGCPGRCVFCSQHAQTGTLHIELRSRLELLERELLHAHNAGEAPFELAFYGGTFTAISPSWQEQFLALAARYREKGQVSYVRCSTRPDYIDLNWISTLRNMGLDLIELGVQSFSNDALVHSGRGYTAYTAIEACKAVRKAGLDLGIQLMPGLPGQHEGQFLRDIHTTCQLQPDCVRLYPCLVFEGTMLASWWRDGKYKPWSTTRASTMLGIAMNTLWSHNIRVIRSGVAYTSSLTKDVLAGAYHPALGSMARGEALCSLVNYHALQLENAPAELWAPKRFQGEFWGHKNTLVPRFARHGLSRHNVHWWDKPFFLMH
ncbi:elongator complex protein 3 [Oleidesulfovibrio sp.]|uniref:elongator complex protein 3 n=1 Tax=Oleidesulfovibrio sp. TaxID=2909707 RepID=UPI003A84CC19